MIGAITEETAGVNTPPWEFGHVMPGGFCAVRRRTDTPQAARGG